MPSSCVCLSVCLSVKLQYCIKTAKHRIVLVGMILQIFVWRSPKGRLYDNQLNMGDVRKRRVERPSLFGSQIRFQEVQWQ